MGKEGKSQEEDEGEGEREMEEEERETRVRKKNMGWKGWRKLKEDDERSLIKFEMIM
jgi:hypothetical protein